MLFIDGLETKYGAVGAVDRALYNYVTGHNSRHSTKEIKNPAFIIKALILP
jgi:hypothetical protein